MKAIKWLDQNIERVFLVLMLVIILIVNTVQIILRSTVHVGLPWVEELSRYLLIWSGFLGVSFTIRYNTAMRLTLIYNIIPRLARNVVSLLVHLIMLAFFVWLTVNSFYVVSITTQSSASMHFSLKYVYACSIACGILSCIRCVQGIVRIIRNFKTGDDSKWDPTAEKGKEAEA